MVALLIAASGLTAVGKDDVITLTLDEQQQSQSQQETAKPGSKPQVDTPDQTAPGSVIQVPPVKSSMGPAPQVQAASAVLMDPVTGQVLYEKNAHAKRPIASTTKIMTAILLIENSKMSEIVTASKNAEQTQFTSIHLQKGEKISAEDLLYALLIRSANDSAVAIAEHVGGTVPKFTKMMNHKAKELGCKDTNFVTPNGLYNPNHYSSAYDLCLMARYAMKYPIFNEVINTRKHVLDSRTKNRKDLIVYSNTRFMKEYPGADGVKSGYIKQARYCYVGSATRDGRRLLAAVLRSGNAGKDAGICLDYGFANFRPYLVVPANQKVADAPVTGGNIGSVTAAVAGDLSVTVPNTGAQVTTRIEFKKLVAPVVQGSIVGSITAVVNGKDAGSVPLRATEQVGLSVARASVPWFKTCGILLICIFAGRRFYGRAITKNSRSRRRRIEASLRDFDRFR